MKTTKAQLMQKAQAVKVLLLDVDGVLTDGRIHILPDGDELYSFNVYDGFGLKLWHRTGHTSGFVTGRKAVPVKHRAKKLGVHHLFQGAGDKVEIIKGIAKKEGVSLSAIAYMGDDLQDLPALRMVGFAATVPNARPELTAAVHYTTRSAGGDGAVRDLVEFLLRAKGLWNDIIEADRISS